MAFTPYSAPPTSDISPVIGEVNEETTWPPYNPRRKPGQTVYVITGANRGLGLALTTTLALRPNTVIFACIRTFMAETTEILTSLPVGQDSYVAPLQIDATAPLHAKQAVETITHMHGYNHVDVVISHCLWRKQSSSKLHREKDTFREPGRVQLGDESRLGEDRDGKSWC